MSQAASQASAFYRDVAKSRRVWTIRDNDGYPMPKTQSGQRAMPLWSSLSRVEKIIKTVPAYTPFQPFEMTWGEWCTEWLPDLKNDGMLVGVNWSGKNATGYDLEPETLREYVERVITNPQ